MKRVLIIFAKEPKKGAVKTRLLEAFSEEKCLLLYKEFLRNTVDLARNIKCSQRIIAYDSGNQMPLFLKKIAGEFEFYQQEGSDLGEKMFNAFKSFSAKNIKTVIIGSDSPYLPRVYLNKAFDELDKNDLVLGPAYDGGYYLIGLKRPCKKIFQNIKWSSRGVFKATLKKAKRLKKRAAVLDFWYDIDTPEDLKYLKLRRPLR